MKVPGFPRQLARTRRFSLGVPQRFTVSPDGDRVLFTRTGGGDDPVGGLWLYGADGERPLADPRTLDGAPGDAGVPEEERVRRERAREASSGIVAYATDREVRRAVFALAGEVWTVDTDGGTPRRVGTAGPAVDPRLSPDGLWIAYVTGGALHVIRRDGTDDRTLAAPEPGARPGDVVYGLSDHVSAESIGRQRGHWWSPASDALLVTRVDNSPVRTLYLSDPANPATPPKPVRYPAAGTPNAVVTVHVVRLDGRRVDVRLPGAADAELHPPGDWTDRTFEYVTWADWDTLGPVVQVQSRDQRSASLLEVDPASGVTRPLHLQRDAAWVELPSSPLIRTTSGAPVAPFVKDDVQGLRIGGVRTPPGLQVRTVLGAVGERVYFSASEDPTETHVWCCDPESDAASPFFRVSRSPGVHTAAAGGDTVVLSSDTDDGGSVTVLRGGVPAGSIEVLAERPVLTPRPVRLSLGERALRSHLFLPSWHRPGEGRLPVLLNPYSGPGIQLVQRSRAWHACVAQWFAEQGFAVLVTDGRGTPGRGHAWARAIRGDRLGPVLQDQVDALHAAADRHPDLDPGAVAIRGWSYGGYLAAGAVLHRPEVFHAAIAGGAPADRRLYDTHWEERFLGHPEVTPENYRRSSLVPFADRLTRPLLLVHGVADDNVLLAHALRLSSALVAAGRPHSVLPLSGVTHTVADQDIASSLPALEVDFLKKSLRK
ncbi:prolyl oligopeptidase family serine peptidase [Streptomyces sp. HNM0663]|uniref:Prolyl oligopeptidase family serine peptidase n=1 Tax=Streptomyces chengmaiensis TaxID=3040919 RepID=A0ABT6HQM0_9ACTN|nr:prolyl oligopeptidase family serine peptidase [Streptomyces chengmaiensis]MDH2390154.1 prolyl oligopeptidase family serine peptidase [Streptomyces chengmaiensis]